MPGNGRPDRHPGHKAQRKTPDRPEQDFHPTRGIRSNLLRAPSKGHNPLLLIEALMMPGDLNSAIPDFIMSDKFDEMRVDAMLNAHENPAKILDTTWYAIKPNTPLQPATRCQSGCRRAPQAARHSLSQPRLARVPVSAGRYSAASQP